MVPVLGHQVQVVDSFIYLGFQPGDESDMDIRRRIELARTCIKALIVNQTPSVQYCQYFSTAPTRGV